MSENLYKSVTRKYLSGVNLSKSEQKGETEKAFAKIFGVDFDCLKRWFLGKGKSELLTKEQIAQKLLDNSLVNNLEDGMKETEYILKNNKGGMWEPLPPRVEFREYLDGNNNKKYRLHFVDFPWFAD
jgi:hypothetical protein